jgi:molybdate transport repressor ModE-like protein
LTTLGVSGGDTVLDVRKLIMLRAIAAEGSIAAAARALKYTRSAVSQHLSALERETGAQLVERTNGRVLLTPVGEELVEHTERILVELRAAEAMLASDPHPIGGLLRVGVPFGEGPRIMSRALTEVRQSFPGLEIRLAATTDETGAEEVRRGLLDMVILSRFGAAHPRAELGLREWILGSDPLRLCVPPGHRLAGAAEAAMAELQDEAWIVNPGSTLGQLTVTLCLTAGFEPVLAASVNDVGTAVGLVGIGWGVTIAPELTPVSSDRPVAHVALAGVGTHRHSVLIVRDGEHLSPRIATAIEAVREVSARSWTATPMA